MTYKPPYTISSSMLNQLSSIMKLVGQLTNIHKLNDFQQIQINRPESIISFIRFENNTLSDEILTKIINEESFDQTKIDNIEVNNVINVYNRMQSINPYNKNDLLEYHKVMLDTLIDSSGKYRKQEDDLLDLNPVNYLSPSAIVIPSYMDDLYDYLNNFEENIFIKSCVFHYELQYIHPFVDGNGKMARLFQKTLLASQEEIFMYVPFEVLLKERRLEYYEAIELSHKNRNSDVFIEFMLSIILETIKRMVHNEVDEVLVIGIQVKKLINIMAEGVPYTTKELLELLDMKSRASFKKNYLDPAISQNLVVMTIPDKPNSRNQRYILRQTI